MRLRGKRYGIRSGKSIKRCYACAKFWVDKLNSHIADDIEEHLEEQKQVSDTEVHDTAEKKRATRTQQTALLKAQAEAEKCVKTQKKQQKWPTVTNKYIMKLDNSVGCCLHGNIRHRYAISAKGQHIDYPRSYIDSVIKHAPRFSRVCGCSVDEALEVLHSQALI